MVATDHRVTRRLPPRVLGGVWLVALLGIAAGMAVIPVTVVAQLLDSVRAPIGLPWWLLAVAFATAEFGVVHLKFRRDAHSFSMSEIPLVAGLFFTSVSGLVLAMAVGSAVALAFVRRQRGVKLLFNIAQFTTQAAFAALVFHVIARLNPVLGWVTWLAALAATVAAFIVANGLVTTAIRATGGRLSMGDLREVVLFGLVGTVVNTALALVGVTLLWVRPTSGWLALVPVAVLFLAYRVYTDQRDERARVQALYEFTLALHGAPSLDDALPVAAAEACRMFEVETAHIVVVLDGEPGVAFRTVANADGTVERMNRDTVGPEMLELIASDHAAFATQLEPHDAAGLGLGSTRSIMSAPIHTQGAPAGVIILGDPLSSVGDFTGQDLKVLETIAGRVALTLENGALQTSLSEVTKLSEELEEVVRSKDRFIATVSHELRNPLTGVIGLTQQLREHRDLLDGEEIDELLGMIHDGSAELGAIIEDLLVAARADLDTLVIKPRSFELHQELSSLLISQSSRSGGKVLDANLAGAMPPVDADPMRIRQIIRNLISNAIRYGGEHIHFELRSEDGFGVLAVVDDGPGVDDESVEEIFEPYGRAKGATHAGSVGLGLSVSRQLARRMGGDLTYRRRDGCTAFELSIPLARSGS